MGEKVSVRKVKEFWTGVWNLCGNLESKTQYMNDIWTFNRNQNSSIVYD